MRQQQTELEALDVNVIVITFDVDFMARAYVADTGLDWPLLVDADRAVYKAYDMLHASFWDIWGPRSGWASLRALLDGEKLRAPGSDVNQRGGNVLVDPRGIVRLHHIGRGPADRPAVETLLEAVRRGSPGDAG